MFAVSTFVLSVDGQVRRELSIGTASTLEITNLYGKVDVTTITAAPDSDTTPKPTLVATGRSSITAEEISVGPLESGRVRIEVKPASRTNRVDISLTVAERSKLKITTTDGEVRVIGDLASVTAVTETGTIVADVPTEDIRYEMLWTESRPRVLADFELEKVKERSGGKFSIKGKHQSASGGNAIAKDRSEQDSESDPGSGTTGSAPNGDELKDSGTSKSNSTKNRDRPTKTIALNFTTARGIILLNVPPNEVMSDLRERPLTEAAKAIIRSGDTLLMDAIRRASPKYFGDYTRTLPPMRREPGLTLINGSGDIRGTSIKTATVRVTDMQNRSVAGLAKEDFEAAESGEQREILSVRPTTAPVNLVLLVDVSGSVENYVNFIRKAAREFIETVDRRDKVSIVLFNEEVKELATFSTDKAALSQSLDTFDAGGATAYYDALGYTLTETLRPLRGARTAVVVLSDGDDNRSFLPFDSLAGTIQESGALIYPLYVPTSLIAAAANDPDAAVDPLRSRYLSNDLTSRADTEGKRLAELSGGVYYPITQLSQIPEAYNDIVLQLRTAYDVTFRSQVSTPDGRPSPRLKIRTNKPNTFVQVQSVINRQ